MANEISSDNLNIVKISNPSSHAEFIHCDTVSSANLAFLKRQKNCDATFEVGQEKKKIQCHRVFLMSRSPVFETMFSENWDTWEGPILLPDVEPETFDFFLQFVYGDEFTANIPTAIKVLQLGDKYNVRPLVQKCEQLMSEDIQLKDAFETFKIAQRYLLQNLMDKAGELLARNFEVISKQSNFRNIDEETLIWLLKRDDLLLAELKLFNIVLRWASDNMEENSSYSDVWKNIIPLIRFPLMTAQEFATFVFPTQILPQKDVIDLFLYFNSDGTVMEDVAKRIQYSSVRRLQPITLKFYEPVPKKLASYHASNEILEYRQNHEDNLEILYKPQSSEKSTHSKVMVESLILEGMNYDSLQEYWPSNRSPEPEIQVRVSVEKLNRSGEGTSLFDRNCFIRKGEQTKLQVFPRIELAHGRKYIFKVQFQGNVLVVKQNGQWDVDWNYDILTNLKLASEVSDSSLAGSLQLTMTKPLSESETDDDGYDCSYYFGPRALHVLKGLMLV
ncbi:unnamed protein product [Allacma fusca]|uniref:BTB domain-containing protein n=1 Tax=Allacma fusca TaxID=39272 RepID=A0A8J2JE62_9HEXA|nr:unnamed protein product [Allacma fusca]